MTHTIFTGRQLQHFESLDSTNRFLRDKVALENDLVAEGFIVVAEEQSGGKGQLGTSWLSEPGKNLLFSVLLRPAFLEPMQVFYLNKAIAIAVRDAVAAILTGSDVRIKWPNDIYVDRNKIAGILIENTMSSSVQNSVIGVGLNVNQENFSVEIPNPVSLIQIAKHEFDRQDILELVCSHIEKNYLRLRRFDFAGINSDYKSKLYGLEEKLKFRSASETFYGVVKDVNQNGNILIQRDDVEVEFEVKELKWVI